jgi:hypothetical protein
METMKIEAGLTELVGRVSEEVTRRLETLQPGRQLAVSHARLVNGDAIMVDIVEIAEGESPPFRGGCGYTIYKAPARLQFSYMNHRGETAQRTITNPSIYFGVTDYYQEPQWLLKGFCLDRKAPRIFALAMMDGFEHVGG